MENYEIHFLQIEEHVCATTLRPKGVTRKAPQFLEQFLETITKSHKRYAFTIKVVSGTLQMHMSNTDHYYHNFMTNLLHQYPDIRNSIWTQETDSLGILHIHGIVTVGKRNKFNFKTINDSFPGHTLYFTKLSKPPDPYKGKMPSQHGTLKSNYKHPSKWYKYMFKEAKQINITAYINPQLKSFLSNMQLACLTENADNAKDVTVHL